MAKNLIIGCGRFHVRLNPDWPTGAERIDSKLNAFGIESDIVYITEDHLFDYSQYDSFVISGSNASVYDDAPWIARLVDIVRDIIASGKPLLGICFGHQIIAEALGGAVSKCTLGWEVGAYALDLCAAAYSSPLFSGIKNKDVVYQSHQDIVTSLPDGAVELARTDKGIQAFSYSDSVYGLQFHPEFDYVFIKELKEIFKQKNMVDYHDGSDLDVKSSLGLVFFENFIKIINHTV